VGHGDPKPDRYEPIPGFTELPQWLWRRMGRGTRIAVGVFVLAVIALTAALAPAIQQSKEERAATERRERAAAHAKLIRTLKAEQRPRFARSAAVAPAGATDEQRLAARAQVMGDLAASILADARRRVRRGDFEGPIRRVSCTPFPRSVEGVGADEDLSRRLGRYACVAVTAEFARSDESIGGEIGHPYRALARFESGRYAFCKVFGRPDPTTLREVGLPRPCGGR